MKTVNSNKPTKFLKPGKDLPWMSKRIKRFIKKKQIKYNRAKKSGSEKAWAGYQQTQKLIRKEMAKAYNDYINILFEESDEGAEQKTGMKRFWSYIKSLRKDTVSIKGLKHQGKLVTTGYEKAAALSAQYESALQRT